MKMKFMRTTTKYTWQYYNTNEDILSELRINQSVKKIQNYRNKRIQHVRQMDRDGLPHLITERKQRTTLTRHDA